MLFEALAGLVFQISGKFGGNYSVMYGLFHAYSANVFLRTSRFVLSSSVCNFSTPLWRRSFQCDAVKTLNLKFLLTRFRVQCYSTRKASGIKSPSKKKVDGKPKPALMKEERDSFFVVRKGDLVGVYKSLSDCQAQVGSSICDPPVSVYKGYSMPKDTVEYLLSSGLKNALYSIRAADLTEELFGTLLPCPFQETPESKSLSNDPRKNVKLDHHLEIETVISGVSGCSGGNSL